MDFTNKANYPRQGANIAADPEGKPQYREIDIAESIARDPDLQKLVNAWPLLRAGKRVAILRIVEE